MIQLWSSRSRMSRNSGKKKTSFISLGLSSKKVIQEKPSSPPLQVPLEIMQKKETFAVRSDSLGYNPDAHHDDDVKIESLGYQGDESEVFRAYAASQHYKTRGKYWNDGKRDIMIRYMNLTMIGLAQGSVAYFTNFFAKSFIDVSD